MIGRATNENHSIEKLLIEHDIVGGVNHNWAEPKSVIGVLKKVLQ